MPSQQPPLSTWNQTQLAKYIVDILRRNPPQGVTKIKVEQAEVTDNLVLGGALTIALDPNWHTVGATGEPAFSNAWAAAGGGYQTPAFWKDPFGFVHLRGRIASGTVGTAAFTLSPGHRPSATVAVPVISNGAVGLVEVSSTGAVTPQSPSSNVYVSLDGISFKV